MFSAFAPYITIAIILVSAIFLISSIGFYQHNKKGGLSLAPNDLIQTIERRLVKEGVVLGILAAVAAFVYVLIVIFTSGSAGNLQGGVIIGAILFSPFVFAGTCFIAVMLFVLLGGLTLVMAAHSLKKDGYSIPTSFILSLMVAIVMLLFGAMGANILQ